MSAQAQLDEIFNSFNIKSADQKKIDDLRECFDEDHVEVFLEKLNTVSVIDSYMDSHPPAEVSDQFIDFISELILKK